MTRRFIANQIPAEPQPNFERKLRQAFAAQQAGDVDKAERLYAAVLRLRPNEFNALHMLGLLNYQRGRFPEALRLIAAALRTDGSSVDAWSNLGLVFHAQGEHAKALTCYDQALAIKPDHADVLNNRGNALHRLGQHDAALDSFAKALATRPDYVIAHHNRGTTLLDRGRVADALASFDAVLALAPNHAETLCHRGNAFVKLNRVEEAVESYTSALRFAPDDPTMLHNHAHALRLLGRPREALLSAEKALRIKPDYAAARFEQSLALLTLGDLRGGFAAYEARWDTEEFLPQLRNLTAPAWFGQDDLTGKTILLHAEQGFGDTLQFARYVPLLAQRGAKIILEVQPELKSLLSRIEGASLVIARGEAPPPFDLHCPLMSVAHALRTELGTIPANVPYLLASAADVARWRDLLPPGEPRVGLAWSGRPTHKHDRTRSIALAGLAPLLAATHVAFVSLQPDVREEDEATLAAHPRLHDIGRNFKSFADTAAVISLLDLVICVDTATAHLAGALGKPVWILVPVGPDFRWLLDREDSPWYPTARLFRQQRFGDWTGAVDRLRNELDRALPHSTRA
jgi:tetratricopeptide (TPR) repeat protein